ncbi:MAG: NAD(P)H-dependent oxidoreductase subunit E [Kouleothrix sp.]|nr:NAD(P)H-dependent oxidoreductase subunit E [Kouleothrix sp.]
MQALPISPPSEDKRWRIVGATLRRHGYRPDALLEALHTVQDSFGYIDRQSLRYLAASLRLPLSQVYAVVTFSPSFAIQSSAATHACAICLGTACQIRGAQAVFDEVAAALGVQPGGKTEDGTVTLTTVRCLASCGMAPAGTFDGEVVGRLTAARTIERIESWTSHES